jgi:hypothetical protein
MTVFTGAGIRSSGGERLTGERADGGRGAAVSLCGIGRSLQDFAPVLAVTVLTEPAPAAKILVGIRTPAANKTHQDVASVPTRRVPLLLAEAWIARLRQRRADELLTRPDVHAEVANLFGMKLGLADPLELGRARFTVVRVDATQGISVIGENDDGSLRTENLTMFNACVMLELGRDEVPPATASYDPLVWANVADFLTMTATFDAGRIDASLADAFVCAYGLCLQTSARMLQDLGFA